MLPRINFENFDFFHRVTVNYNNFVLFIDISLFFSDDYL